jgi:quinoprotein glucose dehydrogenase
MNLRILSALLAFCLLATSLTCAVAAEAVDESPLPVKTVRAFPKLKPRRPVAITHAGDTSGRIFILSEHGQILVGKSDQSLAKLDTFLDIEFKVDYEDKENEEGLLGLAFHPKYKENGEFFVYYTIKNPPHTSVVSRFRVSKSDPNKADPKSEEVLMQVPQPYWNHNGGNLLFGLDGYLYINLGDGGAANDPHGNGQNLGTLLGSLLRIDIDHKSQGKPYAIPKDNPFVDQTGTQPEIYAYGFRNIWGMSIDRPTGLFYAADVGQNLWEEIDLVVKGGNYGWNPREGFHKFDVNNAQPSPERSPKIANQRDPGGEDFIDPIWEYHHDIGKSITGGEVYRGKAVPELIGYYVYADYVTGRLWALKYDEKAKRVVENRSIESNNMPIMCFGSDETGELFLGDSFGNLWRFESKAPVAGEGEQAAKADEKSASELPVVYREDFESGADHWQPLDANQWQVKKTDGGQVFSQFEKKSAYKPPHRSPTNVALLKDIVVGDLELTAKVRSTHPDYGHRDAVVVFGYQDPAHFYYVHLGKQADDHANQIFIVNGAARKKISLTSTTGTNWDDEWHTVRVSRNAGDGTIAICFDDMKSPVMMAKDSTFLSGQIGVGTFDDTSDWDDVVVRGANAE